MNKNGSQRFTVIREGHYLRRTRRCGLVNWGVSFEILKAEVYNQVSLLATSAPHLPDVMFPTTITD